MLAKKGDTQKQVTSAVEKKEPASEVLREVLWRMKLTQEAPAEELTVAMSIFRHPLYMHPPFMKHWYGTGKAASALFHCVQFVLQVENPAVVAASAAPTPNISENRSIDNNASSGSHRSGTLSTARAVQESPSSRRPGRRLQRMQFLSHLFDLPSNRTEFLIAWADLMLLLLLLASLLLLGDLLLQPPRLSLLHPSPTLSS